MVSINTLHQHYGLEILESLGTCGRGGVTMFEQRLQYLVKSLGRVDTLIVHAGWTQCTQNFDLVL